MKIKEFIFEPKNRIMFLFYLLLIILIYYITPILTPLIISAFLAYITYPLYVRTKRVFKFKTIASIFTVIQTLIIIILPLIYLVFELLYSLLDLYKNYLNNNPSFIIELKKRIIELIYTIVPSEVIREQIISALSTITNVIFQKLYNSLITLTFSIPNLIIYLILISLGQFYFLIYGKKILKFLINHLPFDKYNKIIIDSLKKTIDSIIYGLIIPPLVQSIALVLILFLLGIKVNYILVGFIGFLFALIPSLGIWVVWLPLSIKVWSESTGKLIVYFLYNLLVTSNIDFLTRIFVAYKIANVPMWLVIFTSLGGLLSNGFIGMIVALFIGTFLYILYYDLKVLEKKEKNNSF